MFTSLPHSTVMPTAWKRPQRLVESFSQCTHSSRVPGPAMMSPAAGPAAVRSEWHHDLVRPGGGVSSDGTIQALFGMY
jgi:hypothetical protein